VLALRVSIALAAALALDLALSLLHYEHARRLYAAKPPAAVDALIVLFSGSSSDGSVNAETRRRLGWASAIYKTGLTGAIICAGGGAEQRPGAVLMREQLIADGIPAASVLAETRSFDTITNVRHSRLIAAERHWNRLAIVSSPLHVARALRTAREERMDVLAAGYDPRIAEPPVGRLEALAQVHHEWLATLAALLPEPLYLGAVRWWRIGADADHRF
jgi:uncharacterized SAM-binding protein YcdF (DUF218 family)